MRGRALWNWWKFPHSQTYRPNFPLFYLYFVLVLVCLCSFISAAEHQTFTSTMNKFIAFHS